MEKVKKEIKVFLELNVNKDTTKQTESGAKRKVHSIECPHYKGGKSTHCI